MIAVRGCFADLPYDNLHTSLAGQKREHLKAIGRSVMRYASVAGLTLSIAAVVL